MSEQSTEIDDGPECETCGKTDCPDAALPEFSEPRDCAYAPIYHALRDAKDCDYGCARDYTNQAVRLWVVGAVERMATELVAQAFYEARDALYRGEGPDQYEGTDVLYGEWLGNRANRLYSTEQVPS